MTDERRQHVRHTQPLDGTWRGQSGASACRVSDISWGGCFISTLTAPAIGERTTVVVALPSGRSVEISGTIRYVEPTMGFAVEFDTLTPEQVEALRELLGDAPTS